MNGSHVLPHHYYHHVHRGILSRAKVLSFFLGRSKHVALTSETSLYRYMNNSQPVTGGFGICELPHKYCYQNKNLHRFPSLKHTSALIGTSANVTKIPLRLFYHNKNTGSDNTALSKNQCPATESQNFTTENHPSAKENQHHSVQNKQTKAENWSKTRESQWSTSLNRHPLTEDPHTEKHIQHLKHGNKLANIEDWQQGTLNHCIITRNPTTIENLQHTEGYLHPTKRNHCTTSDIQYPTTVTKHLTTENQYIKPGKLLTVTEKHHYTVVVQYHTTAIQCSAADKVPTTAKDHYIMTDNERPTASFRHVKYPSAAHRGAAVSDADAQLMNHARQIFDQAVDSVLPHHLVRNKLKLSQNDSVLKVDDTEYLLQQNVYVIGFGKAVIGMARAVEDCIGKHIVKGVISVPTGIQQTFREEGKQDMLIKPESRIVVMEGATGNLPDEASHKAATEIIKIAEEAKEDEILIILISGGGSALLPSPKPPVTLEDMLSLTRLMSKSGASIIQLNTVRKEIEILKGGGLAKLAQPARVIALILSDVIGDPLDFIAGGPTVKDTSTPEDRLNVLKELGISSAIPSSVSKLLNEEQTKSHERGVDAVDWSRVQNVLVGSNKSACDAACERSATLGYLPYLLSTQMEGEAQDVGRMYINLAKYVSLFIQGSAQKEEASDLENLLVTKFNIDHDKLRQLQELAQTAVASGKKGVCIVAGGETIVVVKGKGIGGRNQEMAVAAALELDAKFSNSHEVRDTESLSTQTKVAFLAAGTDGIDGPNPAAGGVISGGFTAKAAASGLDAVDFLSRNDTYTLLSKVDHGLNHVFTGHTGTNVMDIHILLIAKEP